MLGLAVGSVAGLITLDAASRYKSACRPDCTQGGLDAASTGKTFEVISPVALGVGVAAVAAGAYLVLSNPKKTSSATATLAPTGGRDGAGFAVRGSF